MAKLPSIFVSHGAPSLVIERNSTNDFLRRLGKELGTPKSILVVSAHWEAERPTVSSVEHPQTIYDFSGFPEELYRMKYPAPGAPDLAMRVVDLLRAAGENARVSPTRGLDHGAWVPLILMFPEANIPVTQLSVQTHLGAAAHYQLGSALAPLRDEGVLILTSGGSVHNLPYYFRYQPKTMPEWGVKFENWLHERITAGAVDDIVNYRKVSPEAVMAHPTEEHFLPLPVAMGAGGRGTRIHYGEAFSGIDSSAYSFE